MEDSRRRSRSMYWLMEPFMKSLPYIYNWEYFTTCRILNLSSQRVLENLIAYIVIELEVNEMDLANNASQFYKNYYRCGDNTSIIDQQGLIFKDSGTIAFDSFVWGPPQGVTLESFMFSSLYDYYDSIARSKL